jgi:transposase
VSTSLTSLPSSQPASGCLTPGHNRKTDALDAHSIAVVAVRTKGLRVLQVDGELEAMRMLTDRREALTRRRVQTVNRLQALLAELLPGRAKKDITPLQAKAMLASVRPRDIAGKTRRRIAAEELAELIAIDSKMRKATAELKTMVLTGDSSLMDLDGVGPVVAARILADVGDIARFADRNRFASWTGTAPLDASSGEQNRHRLSRAGNRRINHMIHIAAVTQLRLDTEGRTYYRRKRADGKKPLEAMRCLKRRIPDAIYRQLLADAQRAALAATADLPDAGPGGHCGASQESSAIDPPPHIDTSDQPLPGPARPTLPGTKTRANPPHGFGSSPTAPARQSRQGGAPHRTNDLDGDKRRRTLQGAETTALTTEGSRSDAGVVSVAPPRMRARMRHERMCAAGPCGTTCGCRRAIGFGFRGPPAVRSLIVHHLPHYGACAWAEGRYAEELAALSARAPDASSGSPDLPLLHHVVTYDCEVVVDAEVVEVVVRLLPLSPSCAVTLKACHCAWDAVASTVVVSVDIVPTAATAPVR